MIHIFYNCDHKPGSDLEAGLFVDVLAYCTFKSRLFPLKSCYIEL